MAQFTIRIPDEMHEQIKHTASGDRRSMNGQIEWLISQGIAARSPQPATVASGDTIRIRPDRGAERLMTVAHVEHHVITLADVPTVRADHETSEGDQ